MVHAGHPLRDERGEVVDLTLEVGALTETVTVASAAELLQTDKADISTELKSDAITQMPLNGRNFAQLTLLVPGSITPKPDSFMTPSCSLVDPRMTRTSRARIRPFTRICDCRLNQSSWPATREVNRGAVFIFPQLLRDHRWPPDTSASPRLRMPR